MKSQTTERWTEPKVFEAIRKVFPPPAFVLLPQVRNGTGYERSPRTADAVAISTWPSRGLYLAGIEIKVTLSDWRRELANAQKAHDIAKYCRYWYVAAPAGVIPVGEVPETWGLVECNGKSVKIVKPAVKVEPQPIDILLLASILRAAAADSVPRHHVAAQISAEVKARVEAVQKTADYDLERMRNKIAQFEEASGVKLGNWQEKQIGEAVKMVMAGDHLQLNRQLQSIGQIAERILEVVRNAMGEKVSE